MKWFAWLFYFLPYKLRFLLVVIGTFLTIAVGTFHLWGFYSLILSVPLCLATFGLCGWSFEVTANQLREDSKEMVEEIRETKDSLVNYCKTWWGQRPKPE